jgi:ubiquinone/menaquinone biosynthesis C-methylase UbiE
MNVRNKMWDGLYEKSGNLQQSPFTSDLHNKVLKLIPDDVTTILDAGCGGGAFMSFLSENGNYKVEGVDQSPNGVRFVNEKLNMKAQVGDLVDLSQFPDKSFDMVVCSEVTEHLPMTVLVDVVNELARVTKKYLIFTNPFLEKLTANQLTCTNCLTRYHIAGHIHSIDESFMSPIVAPLSASVSFHYSGEREYVSTLYCALLRATGHRLSSLDASCPLCEAEVPHKKWGILVRLSGYTYRISQKILKFFGVKRPANIITLVRVN